MIERLAFGLCAVLLVVFVGTKLWDKVEISEYEVIQAAHEDKQSLSGQGVHVAVLDEGFDLAHDHLSFSLNRFNTDHNRPDITESVIYKNGSYEFESHGTHVSGIILNLAPEASIIPVQIGHFGGDQAFVKAIDIATQSNADIVNISMRLSHTGRELSPNVRAALIRLAESGKLIVIAAGNESSPLMRSAYTSSLVELAHNPHIKGRLLIVGATSYKGGKESLATFSNYPGNSPYGAAQTYFIAAPGEQISSTITGGAFGEKSGTSMATPMVVGTASLVKQAFPHLSMEEVSYILLKSARKISLNGEPLQGKQFGAGILNLKSALEFARSAFL